MDLDDDGPLWAPAGTRRAAAAPWNAIPGCLLFCNSKFGASSGGLLDAASDFASGGVHTPLSNTGSSRPSGYTGTDAQFAPDRSLRRPSEVDPTPFYGDGTFSFHVRVHVPGSGDGDLTGLGNVGNSCRFRLQGSDLLVLRSTGFPAAPAVQAWTRATGGYVSLFVELVGGNIEFFEGTASIGGPFAYSVPIASGGFAEDVWGAVASDAVGQMGVVSWWDHPLTAGERAQLVAYDSVEFP